MEFEDLNIDPNRTIQTKYAAKLLEVTESCVKKYCRNGNFDYKKINGRLNINLKSFLEKYKNTIVLPNFLKEEKQSKILDVIRDSNYLGKFEVNHETRSFKAIRGVKNISAVYFIVEFVNGKIDFSENNVIIQKVGKADGEFGLQQRLRCYRRNNFKNKHKDKTIEKMYTVFLENFLDKNLHIFYMPVFELKLNIPGNFEVEISPAREIEKMYAFYARVQGHPLLLSSCD